jgi:putative flippase GtrA
MIRRELGAFLVVGSLSVLTDYLIYRFLLRENLLTVEEAKCVGFIAGTVFGYFANRHWTFGGRLVQKGSPWRFALLYAITLSVNIGLNAVALNAFIALTAAVPLAFLIATAVSATMNFVGMKFFVFKSIAPLKTI